MTELKAFSAATDPIATTAASIPYSTRFWPFRSSIIRLNSCFIFIPDQSGRGLPPSLRPLPGRLVDVGGYRGAEGSKGGADGALEGCQDGGAGDGDKRNHQTVFDHILAIFFDEQILKKRH